MTANLVRRLPVDPPTKPAQRSRVTNGAALFPKGVVDGRSPWVRRCRDVFASHLSDLGGMDQASAAEQSIIRRAAVLTTELERLEVVFALAGEASAEQLDIYARIAANLRRLLESVGLQRRTKPVQSLDEYLAAKAKAKEIAAMDAAKEATAT
jgi:hypothetical protein